MPFLKYLVALILGCSVAFDSMGFQSTKQSAGSWNLVYSHDKSGQVLSGTKQALIEAVRAGKLVRIYWASGRVEHLIDAHFITIFGDEVFAQISIQGQKPSMDPPTIELRDAPWHAIFSTNGERAVKWYIK